ncbi:uncharacterized protein LOC121872066 [Homarus americanus]|uniref:uncharacterized protein LOC121872066 n=1 Tax=Homarus americanus TaxID=6706 RepID=UPI001C44992C|nr:uncharacterized protein LOC121872066 [Homarus americanus]
MTIPGKPSNNVSEGRMYIPQEADMGLGPFAMTEPRASVIVFTTPILSDYSRMIGGRGVPEIDPWGFLLPLAPQVLAATLAALVTAVFVVVILSYFAATRDSSYESLSSVFFIYYRVLLQQDRVTRENKTWQRILTAAWILTTVILTWSYCSNLTSQMTVLYTSHPYQTAEDFIQDTEAVLYVETDTADAQILKNANSGILHKLGRLEDKGRLKYKRQDENNFILTAMITGQPLVLLLDDLTSQVIMGQHFSQTGRCDYYASRETILHFTYCMIVQKDSPLLPAINTK